MAKRGRPPNNTSKRVMHADTVIACSVHQLLNWGFSLDRHKDQPGAAEIVGQLVRLVDQERAAGLANSLSGERVKQIYRCWLGDGMPDPFAEISRRARAHSHQAKPWRRQFRPAGHTLQSCAAKLLANEGAWPADELAIKGWAAVVLLVTQQAWLSEGMRIPAQAAPATSLLVGGDSVLGLGAPVGWKTARGR